jgi:hypothetical protein
LCPSRRQGSFANGSSAVGAPDGEKPSDMRDDAEFGAALVEDAAARLAGDLLSVLL